MNISTRNKLSVLGWELISKDKPGIYVRKRGMASSQRMTSSQQLKDMDRAFDDFLKKNVKNTQGAI